MFYESNLSAPYLGLISSGHKVFEARLNRGKWKKMKIGDTILFNGSLLVEIEMILTFSNFRTMLQILGLKQVLPEVKSLEEGVMIYDRIYPKISQPLDPDLSADEREEMVVAFRLKVLHD